MRLPEISFYIVFLTNSLSIVVSNSSSAWILILTIGRQKKRALEQRIKALRIFSVLVDRILKIISIFESRIDKIILNYYGRFYENYISKRKIPFIYIKSSSACFIINKDQTSKKIIFILDYKNKAATPILFTSVVPTIDLAENLSPKYITLQFLREYRVVQYPATSFSQSYINWNIIPPSLDRIISRYVRVTLPLTLRLQDIIIAL
jgi:hypothetical protein